MKSKKHTGGPKKQANDESKKPYRAPKLTVHGTVEKITKAGVGKGAESLSEGSSPT